MDDLDARVRLAAFRFLETQVRLGSDDTSLRRDVLQRGFTYAGVRVPLLGPQGTQAGNALPPGEPFYG